MKLPLFTHWNFSWRQLCMNLLGTLALGLALGSALASSVASREGNWVGAVGLAIFSLLLALTISLTVVPHLLNRVRGEWLTFQFNTTREGWIYMLILFITGVAAFNSGNNHKIIRSLCFLPFRDLVRKIFYGILYLIYICSK